jgi:hypothetical protein
MMTCTWECQNNYHTCVNDHYISYPNIYDVILDYYMKLCMCGSIDLC